METTFPLILRYGGLFVLLLTFGWWIQTKDWEPAIAFISLLIGFIGQDIYFHRRNQNIERNIERDKQLLADLLKILTGDEIRFLKQHDHGGSFRLSQTDKIYEFAETWNVPDREFLNPKLEGLRKKLIETANEYVNKNAIYTYSYGPNIQRLSEYLAETNFEKWEQQRQELNILADEVAKNFEELVREARKRL